jgi:hypothetical protein
MDDGFLPDLLYGFVLLIAGRVLIPPAIALSGYLIMWLVRRPAERARQWRALDPVEQNLQRASHGAAYAVLPLVAGWLVGSQAVVALFSGFAPAARVCMIGACAIWFVAAIARCVGGWRNCAGVRDGFLAARAFTKLTSGATLLVLLHHPSVGWNVRNGNVLLALFLVSSWLIVTGLVRFVILVRPAGSALPEVEANITNNEFDWNR